MTNNNFSILETSDESSFTTPLVVVGEPVHTSHPETKEGTPIDITKSVAEDEKHLVNPAGVGGAVVGFLFGGPIGSALLGFGSAYAVRKNNGAGDVARALGELTISVQEKTARIEEKNHYFQRTKDSINSFCEDEEEKSVAFKTRAFLISGWTAVSTYTSKHQLLERGVEGTGKGFEFIGSFFGRLIRKCDQGKEESKEGLVFVTKSDVEMKDGKRTEKM